MQVPSLSRRHVGGETVAKLDSWMKVIRIVQATGKTQKSECNLVSIRLARPLLSDCPRVP